MAKNHGIEPVVLTGKEVELRPMREGDADALWEAGNFPDIWAFTPTAAQTLDQMKQWMGETLRAAERGDEMPFVIRRLSDGQVIGSTRYLDMSAAHRGLEIGWTWLTPSARRTRANTECKYLLLRHAFETMGMIRVQFKTDARNERSQQAIARIGGVREGVLRRHRIMWDGYIRDSVYFSIVAEEWPSVKERLEEMLAR